MSVVLDESEIVALTGGLRQAAAQLRWLKAHGYWRADRSTVTGRVILERGHYDAVAAGGDQPARRKPTLHLPA